MRLEHTAGDFNADLSQTLEPLPRHLRVGVLHGGDYTCHAGLDQRLSTGRRTPVVTARFKGYIGTGTAGQLAGLAQCVHFGMWFTGTHMPAFTDNLAVAHNHTANARIRMGRIHALTGQLQGSGHVVGVEYRAFVGHAHSLAGTRARRSISSRNSLRSWKRR
ncbi:hypothetical protein D3C72_1944310 [compost metagenome]